MKKLVYILWIITLAGCQQKATETLDLPSLISQGMVLEQQTDVTLWGKSAPGATVQISGSWGESSSTVADATGNWQTKLKTAKAGGPYEVTISTKDTTVTLGNVLLGEVWLCSGQSNMEMPLQGWPADTINYARQEVQAANYPEIHLFTVPRAMSFMPVDSCEGSWAETTPETAKTFSATAYFFGRKLYEELKVPIGLIHSSWGGTPAESWTTQKYLKKIPAYSSIVDSLQQAEKRYDALMKWISSLPSVPMPEGDDYTGLKLDDQQYAAPDFNDSAWETMKLPALWEGAGLPGFDGIVWFRKTIEVPASLAGKSAVLHLGAIDDMDVTFVNGRQVGEMEKTGLWQSPRDYQLPEGLLKAGKNVIAVRVIDNAGGGGLYDMKGLWLTVNSSKKVDLNGSWKYMPEAELINNTFYVFGEGDKSYSSMPKLPTQLSPYTPSVLYNAMINPLVPYTIKGTIWYQGESNVGKAYEYRTLFPAMINSWREVWNEGNFPFYYVQIAPFNYGEKTPSAAAELREAQLKTLSLPNTGMVVTTDIGSPLTIHPGNKQEVGRRLALWALAKNYGYDSLVYSGPLYDTISTEGNAIIVHFTHVDGGLVAKGPLTYFEIAGQDKVFFPANAEIKGETVKVWSDKVKQPVAVRFGWRDTAEPNLFNKAGLPASPFRSDDWQRLTQQSE